MSALLTVRDESATGQLMRSFLLEFPWEVTTVREVLRARVEHEVSSFNAAQGDAPFNGLVQPTGAERVLNGFKLTTHRNIDWHEQFERALLAFENNQFFMLIDDRQVESLEEQVIVREATQVSFVKLVPLVGG